VYLVFDIKYRSSKIHVFLLFIKPVFPMFDKSQDCSSKCGCILKAVRGCRRAGHDGPAGGGGGAGGGAYEHGCEFAPIARQKIILPKFLVPLAGFIRIRTRRTVLRLCQSNGKTA